MANKNTTLSGGAAARQAAADLRAKQRAASRRRAGLAAIVAVVILGGFIATIAYVVKNGSNTSGPYQYNPGNGASPGTDGVPAPTEAELNGGILVTAAGVAGGEPVADAIRVDLYEDPRCPVCKEFDAAVATELGNLNQAGVISLYFHPIAILDWASSGSQYSTRSVSALWTVAEYAPDDFWTVVQAFYTAQPPENTKGLTNEEIADVIRTAGVSEDVIAKLPEGEFTPWTLAATSQAQIDGVGGTPTIRIAGVDQPFWYYMYFPGILTYDALVVTQTGADGLAAVAAERAAAASSGATEEESNAAIQALLQQQVADLEAAAGVTPSPSPSPSS